MAPKKNVGGPKGKGPAKKTSAKRPLPPSESSSGEDDVSAEELNALMARMEKFERERGLSTREAGPRPARRASRKLIFKNLLSRMSVLEAGHTAVRRDGEEPEQPEPSREEQGPTAPSVDQPQAARGQAAADQSAPSALTDAAPAISRPQLEIPEVRPETIATSSAAAPAYPVRASPSAAPAVSGSVSVGQPSVQASVVDGPSTSSDGAIQAAGTRRGRGSRTHAGPSLEGWSDETALGMSLALAPSSRKSYIRAVQEFLDFRQQYNLPGVMPVPYEQLAQFCVYNRRRGLAPQSIRSKLSALAYWFKAQGLSDPTDDFRIHKFLTGWSRQRGHPRDERQPMTPAIMKGLKQLWPRLCTSHYEQVLFHAAALTAFFGALRVSELVALSKSDTSHRALLISDIKVLHDSMEINIRASKTDQESKGQVFRLLKCSEEDLCPVMAMTQFTALRGGEKGYLFSHQDGKPLTKYQFWTITAKALDMLGLGHLKFGTHSFRIGAATAAAEMGYGDDEIKAIGRWRSGAFRGYVRSVSS
ncbi:uncharacterized protein [Anolis sagrei]|uniref:uncharacterized protein isoform X2 n=1 Tax=Anolis sagrei TaxID=38937 RepID=UPI00352209A2